MIPSIQGKLESLGHELSFPNTYPDVGAEDRIRLVSEEERGKWKATMFEKSLKSIERNDAVLVLNFNKDDYKNYIGGATFLEMYDAFRLKKKIFMYNDIPEGILKDEIGGFLPIVINGDLTKIK
jgi:nucleoside 2-deoxyribosyltransferase